MSSLSNLISNNGISAGSRIDCASVVVSGSVTAPTSVVSSTFTNTADAFFQSGATCYVQGATEVKIRSPSSTELISATSSRVQIAKPLVVSGGAGQYIRIPSLTTAEKTALTAVNGMLVYDSTLNKFQGYENGAWTSLI